MIKILHLVNDYAGSSVYRNLTKKIDGAGIPQVIYTAIRSHSLINRNKIDFENDASELIYSHILNKYTRFDYYYKIKKVFKDVLFKVKITEVSVIHAHTWFSDGGVAYELYKKFKIPYLITIRNSDLNLFFKYMIHLRSYGLEILRNASRIIFISPLYKKRLFKLSYFSKVLEEFQQKSLILPNGVDDFWVRNTIDRKQETNETPLLVFVGRFTRGKNIIRLIKSVDLLNEKGFPCVLQLIGGDGSEEAKIRNIVKDNKNIELMGKIADKKVLKKIYRKSDLFVMPSRTETFGLVYVEAISQGIPILFTKNEGIDGMHVKEVGESVEYKDTVDIAEKIKKVLTNYNTYTFNPHDIVSCHDWNIISKEYIEIYNKISHRYKSIKD